MQRTTSTCFGINISFIGSSKSEKAEPPFPLFLLNISFSMEKIEKFKRQIHIYF